MPESWREGAGAESRRASGPTSALAVALSPQMLLLHGYSGGKTVPGCQKEFSELTRLVSACFALLEHSGQ